MSGLDAKTCMAMAAALSNLSASWERHDVLEVRDRIRWTHDSDSSAALVYPADPTPLRLSFAGVERVDLRDVCRTIASARGLDAQALFVEACQRLRVWCERNDGAGFYTPGPFAALEVARQSLPVVRWALDSSPKLRAIVERYERDGVECTSSELRDVNEELFSLFERSSQSAHLLPIVLDVAFVCTGAHRAAHALFRSIADELRRPWLGAW